MQRTFITTPFVGTLAILLMAIHPLSSRAQEVPSAPIPKVAPAPAPATNPAARRITLQDALSLATKNSVQYQAALTDAALIREDRAQSRDALLPGVDFTTSALSTKANQGAVAFIANNAPHEYVSQGNVHQSLDLASFASYRKTAALAAAAKARAQVASRGLVVTVVQNYFAAAAAEQKLAIAQRTANEGEAFFRLTQDLEKGGEAAHSDVIKAELQAQERRRQLQEAQLGVVNARLDLAVLLFPDFNDSFELAEDLHAAVPLPTREQFEAQASHDNPDVRAALEDVRAAGHDVNAARAGYLPTVALDYWYGIDAERYAVNSVGPAGQKFSNLGSSAMASLNLTLWNWGATQSRVRQAQLKRDQAKRELSFAQRKLLAEMRSLYAEAETSLNELSGLQRSADLASESLRLTTLRYRNGEATVLEVVDAQTTFMQSNSAYQDGALRYRVALANLQTLTGVLTTQ
ncbi:MAG TPA: TolC family protein [Candidatus Acidoferrum sp.]